MPYVAVLTYSIKMSFSFFSYQKKSYRQVKKIWLKTESRIIYTTIFFYRKPLIVYTAWLPRLLLIFRGCRKTNQSKKIAKRAKNNFKPVKKCSVWRLKCAQKLIQGGFQWRQRSSTPVIRATDKQNNPSKDKSVYVTIMLKETVF